MAQTFGVAVLEDDPTTRRHFEQAIAGASRLELAWSAESIAEAEGKLGQWPELLVLDLGLPDGHGSSLVDHLQRAAQRHGRRMPKVLVVSVFDDRRSVLQAVRSGADGYLLKQSDAPSIVEAIEALLDGGAPMSPKASVHLTAAVRDRTDTPASGAGQREAPTTHAPALTPRERDVLTLLAKGLSYRATGLELGITQHTVGDFVKSIYRKLEVNSRAQAVYRGIRHNLIQLE